MYSILPKRNFFMNNPYQDILDAAEAIQTLTQALDSEGNPQILDIITNLNEFTTSIREMVDLFDTVHDETEIQDDRTKVSQYSHRMLKNLHTKPIMKRDELQLTTTIESFKRINKQLAKLYVEVLHKTEMPKMKL